MNCLLVGEIGEHGLGRRAVGFSLCKLGAIVGRLDFRQDVAAPHGREILHGHCRHVAGDLGRQRREVSHHERVVGPLPQTGSSPPIPVIGDEPGGHNQDVPCGTTSVSGGIGIEGTEPASALGRDSGASNVDWVIPSAPKARRLQSSTSATEFDDLPEVASQLLLPCATSWPTLLGNGNRNGNPGTARIDSDPVV